MLEGRAEIFYPFPYKPSDCDRVNSKKYKHKFGLRFSYSTLRRELNKYLEKRSPKSFDGQRPLDMEELDQVLGPRVVSVH